MDNQINEQLKEEIRQKKLERNRKLIILMPIFMLVGFIFASRFVTYRKYDGDDYGYLSGLYYKQNIESVEIINNYKANKTILNNLNIYLPEGFEIDSFNSNEYCETYKKNYNKLTYDAEIKICDNHGAYLRNTGSTGIEDDEEFKKVMSENSLNNTVDVLKYYIDILDYKASFFGKKKEMKLNYYVRYYTDHVISKFDNFYFLENDVNGIYYVYEEKENVIGVDSINRAFVECNDKFYILNFKNKEVDYFNRDIVFEIISSITNKK